LILSWNKFFGTSLFEQNNIPACSHRCHYSNDRALWAFFFLEIKINITQVNEMHRLLFSIYAMNLANFLKIEVHTNFTHFSCWNHPFIRVKIIKMCHWIFSIFRWPIEQTAIYSSLTMPSIRLWTMRMGWTNGRKRRLSIIECK
jgi:hypothetical protein